MLGGGYGEYCLLLYSVDGKHLDDELLLGAEMVEKQAGANAEGTGEGPKAGIDEVVLEYVRDGTVQELGFRLGVRSSSHILYTCYVK